MLSKPAAEPNFLKSCAGIRSSSSSPANNCAIPPVNKAAPTGVLANLKNILSSLRPKALNGGPRKLPPFVSVVVELGVVDILGAFLPPVCC